MPPNDFATGGLPAEARGEEAGDPLRENEDEGNDEEAEEEPPEIGGARDLLLQPDEGDRADDRAADRVHPAQQHHQQPVDRPADRDIGRKDATFGIGKESAGEAREAGGDGKRAPLQSGKVDAGRLGAQRRITPGAQGIAERREAHASQQENAGAAQSERHQVVDGLVARPIRRPDAEQAVVAAGDRAPLECHRPDDLGEGERQHRQIDAGKADAEPAEQAADKRGGERRREETGRHRRRLVFDQQGGRVGAETEIGGMAEGCHTAGSHDEMQRGGEQRQDGKLGEHGQRVVTDAERQQRENENGGDKEEPAAGRRQQHRRRAAASGGARRSERPAMTRKIRTSVILGKTTMPKACSVAISSAAR